MKVFRHILITILAIVLVLPASIFVLALYGVNPITVAFTVLLLAATLLSLHNVRLTTKDYLHYRAKKRLDTADKRG